MNNSKVIKINASTSLEARLSIPGDSTSIIIFAHDSGSSATSSRNQVVAKTLNDNGFGTLLFDLLTKDEKESDTRTQQIIHELPGATLNKFNIELLTERLDAVTQWVQNDNHIKHLSIGYFGASTGAAAALYAAASFRDIMAVVLQGGRTDLVDKTTLREIKCPCLFTVGSYDKRIIEINRKTIDQLTNVKDKKLEVIDVASQLFEEGNKVEEMGNIVAHWLKCIIQN